VIEPPYGAWWWQLVMAAASAAVVVVVVVVVAAAETTGHSSSSVSDVYNILAITTPRSRSMKHRWCHANKFSEVQFTR
jgi:hypothetical protein